MTVAGRQRRADEMPRATIRKNELCPSNTYSAKVNDRELRFLQESMSMKCVFSEEVGLKRLLDE